MISLGIDPSTSKTGLVALGAEKGNAHLIRHELIKPKTTWTTLAKQQFMWSEILNRIEVIKPDVITIEHYGLNLRNPSAIIPLVGLGEVLRYLIRREGLSYLSPTPAEMKMFATEKGNTKKDGVIAAATQMGYETKSDDMADAFFLSLIGLCFKNTLNGLTQKQREVIGQIKLLEPCK